MTAPRPVFSPVRGGASAVMAPLMARAATYPDTLRLSRGDPDFPTPSHVVDAVRSDLATSPSEHAIPPEGLMALRAAIAARLQAVNRLEVDPVSEVVVTQGGQEAVFLTVMAAIGPGEEMIIPEPNYYSFAEAIAIVGGIAVPVITRVEEGFAVHAEAVRAAITPRTRALLLASPNNPSAAVMSPATVRALVDVSVEHDLAIIADDTYDQFLYEGAAHLSPATISTARPRTMTVNTCSKSYAMTGWRLGWIAGPADLLGYVRRLKEAATGGTSLLAQRAALAALTGPQEVIGAMRDAYDRRRRLVLSALDRMGLRYGTPRGGQFVMVDIRPTGLRSVDFASRLLERGHVLVGPGVIFGERWDGFIRIAWLLPDEDLNEGLERMADAIRAMA